MPGPFLSVADFIPDIELRAEGGARVRLRDQASGTTVLIAIHSPECAGCREYVGGLAPAAGEFRDWDARVLVIVPGPAASPVAVPFGRVLNDERRQIATGSSASAIVADRYSQVFYATHTGASHNLPPPRELDEWIKYLGTLCPE